MQVRPAFFRVVSITLFASIAGAACRKNESDPHASQIVRHAEETREVLANRAVWMGRGPTTPQDERTINDLNSSGEAIERQAQHEAAAIRDSANARGGGPVVSTATVRSIANARCEMESACGAVPGPRFATPLACSSTFQTDGYMGWQSSSCAQHGFDGDRLERCLARIRASTCEGRSAPIPECSPNVVCPQH